LLHRTEIQIILNNVMLVKCSFDELTSENTSYSVTLVPRLDFSINLLSTIIEILQKQRSDLKNQNDYLVTILMNLIHLISKISN